jgi:hypothetical protein
VDKRRIIDVIFRLFFDSEAIKKIGGFIHDSHVTDIN